MKFLALTFLLVASVSCFPDPAQIILDAAAPAVQSLNNGLTFDVQKLIADLKKMEADVQAIIGAIKSGQKDQIKHLLQTLVNDAKQLLKDLGLLRLSDEYEVDLGIIGLDENGELNLDVEKLTKDLTKVLSDVQGLIMAIKEHQTPAHIILAVSRLGTDLVALLQDIAQANTQQVALEDLGQVISAASAPVMSNSVDEFVLDVDKITADFEQIEKDGEAILAAAKAGQTHNIRNLGMTLLKHCDRLLKDIGLDGIEGAQGYKVDLGLINVEEDEEVKVNVEEFTAGLKRVMSDGRILITSIKEGADEYLIALTIYTIRNDLYSMMEEGFDPVDSQQIALDAAEVTGIADLIEKIKKMIAKISQALKTCAVPNAKAMRKDIDAMKDLIGEIANGTSPFVLIHNLTDAFQKLVGDLQTIAHCFHPDNSFVGLQASMELRDSLIDRIKAIIKKFCDALENCAKPEAKEILKDVERVKALIDELLREDNVRPSEEVMEELCREFQKVVGEMGTMAECFRQ